MKINCHTLVSIFCFGFLDMLAIYSYLVGGLQTLFDYPTFSCKFAFVDV